MASLITAISVVPEGWAGTLNAFSEAYLTVFVIGATLYSAVPAIPVAYARYIVTE